MEKKFIEIEYWFQNNDDYDFDIVHLEAPKTMEEIQSHLKLLRGHYIKPSNIIIK